MSLWIVCPSDPPERLIFNLNEVFPSLLLKMVIIQPGVGAGTAFQNMVGAFRGCQW